MGIDHTLKMKHVQVENTTEEETIIATTNHVIHRLLGVGGGGGEGRYLKYCGYDISTVNLLNRYEFEKHELNGQRPF